MSGAALPQVFPALTSVRFFLALGVVLFHLQLTWSWPTLEWTGFIERSRLGVDVFFILSGFVLTHVYARQVEAGGFDYRRFLIARIARIYPAHIIILLGMGGVALVAMALGEQFDPKSYSLLGFLQTALLIHAWFPTTELVEWNGPSWSLSAEWAAYLLFPLFLAVGMMLQKRPLVLLAIAVALFLALDELYRTLMRDELLHAEFNLGVLRIAPTFIGGIGLYMLAAKVRPGRSTSIVFAVTTVAAMAILMHLRADQRLIVAMSGMVVLGLAWLSAAAVDGPLKWPALLFLGEASYAIYLLHLPLITVWKNARAILFGGDSTYVMPMGEAALLATVIILGGCLIHAVMERPARLWIRKHFLSDSKSAPAIDRPVL